MLSLLSHLFITERHRPRAGTVGHQVPLASEIDVADRLMEPLMVTSTQGTFLQSRVARAGYVRFGFSECGLDQEDVLIREFHRVLSARAEENGWACLADSVEAALSLMRANGARPRHLLGDAELTATPVEGVAVMNAGFPRGQALLVSEPSHAGLHTRVGEYVGIVAYRVDRTFVVVNP